MTVDPTVKPETTPFPSINATVGLVLFQNMLIQLPVASRSVVDPTQMLDAPMIVDIGNAFTVIVPVAVAAGQAPPEVVMVYGYIPPSISSGAPFIVNVVPLKLPLIPVGNPETLAPVAPPPIV